MHEPKIFVASDSISFDIKNEIVQFLRDNNRNFLIEDIGPDSSSTFDYPVYALMVADLVKERPEEYFGILVSKNGNEMAIAANKIKDIRAVLCWNILSAEEGRKILDANILCLPSNIKLTDNHFEIVNKFIQTKTINNASCFRERYLLEKLTNAL
jgi:ribose 5-phosphate isomerase B